MDKYKVGKTITRIWLALVALAFIFFVIGTITESPIITTITLILFIIVLGSILIHGIISMTKELVNAIKKLSE